MSFKFIANDLRVFRAMPGYTECDWAMRRILYKVGMPVPLRVGDTESSLWDDGFVGLYEEVKDD